MLNVLENSNNLESFKVQCPMSIEQEEQSKVNECDFTEEKQRNVWFWKMKEQRDQCLVIHGSIPYCLDQETLYKNKNGQYIWKPSCGSGGFWWLVKHTRFSTFFPGSINNGCLCLQFGITLKYKRFPQAGEYCARSSDFFR